MVPCLGIPGRREGESHVVIPVLTWSGADSRLTESDFGVLGAEIQEFTGQVSVGVCAKNNSPASHSQRHLVPLAEENWELIIRVEKKECRFPLYAAVISSLEMPCLSPQ